VRARFGAVCTSSKRTSGPEQLPVFPVSREEWPQIRLDEEGAVGHSCEELLVP
jgi:hypothetical protein